MVESAGFAERDKTAHNRERAERRRAVVRTVRAQREKLTSATGTRPAFDYELMLTFARNRLSAAAAILLLIGLVTLTGLIRVPLPLMLGWTGAVLALHGVMVSICGHFNRLQDPRTPLRGWTVRFVLAELAYGIGWAGVLVILEMAGGGGLDVFQFATALVIMAVGAMLASTVPAAAVAGTLPTMFTAATIFTLRGDLLHVALAIMAAGAEAFFLILAGRLYSATLSMLESRAEKDLLIAELGTANAISDESRRRAEEANLAKSRFLATMSHELRTPLNAILGFSEVMKNQVLGPMDNTQYREYAADIHASGQHLLRLINEILDLSRIEAGRYELVEEPVNLAHVVAECHHLMQLKARNKNITITEQIEPNMPRLWADERAVRQIVLNLLANAVKFTQNGGDVVLKVGWTAGGGQYLSVKDNGPGIPEEEIPIVLSSFGQGSIAIKNAEQGTGLGLPIVQALMHTHDGSFELKSKLREGTEAIAIFPRARVMEALPPMQEEPRGSRWRRTG
jgi:two-component system cell cycle sensor histidine kinase PleC